MSYKFVIPTFLSIMWLLSAPLVSAHVGTVTSYGTNNPPTLDGTIGKVEWADAKLYENVGYNGMMDIYLKHDNVYFYIGIRGDYKPKHDRYLAEIRFDEGDDGAFGSGSHDGVLKINQEDCKGIYWDGWKFDGYWGYNENIGENLFDYSDISIDFAAAVAFHYTCSEFEFRIPYQGVEGRSVDPSDLTISTTDIVGVMFEFQEWYTEQETWHGIMVYFPEMSDPSLPTTWFDLEFDSDRDGLSDNEEAGLGTSLWNSDTDGDNLSDAEEVRTYQTNPLDSDTDNDGLQDNEEIKTYGTNPLKLDTDDDGLADNEEILTHGTDPLKLDTDDDGLNDNEEIVRGTNPLDSDTDGDNLTDGEEVNTYGSNPLALDSDNDGLDDGVEVKVHGTSPVKTDTDGDGLSDKREVELGLSPLKTDSDGDFWGDPMDPWPTNALLPNGLIILVVIICIIGVIWWRKR